MIPPLIIFFLLVSLSIMREEEEDIEREKLWKENQLLKSELKLAQKPRLYFIFDLEKGEILLKARGIVLREFKTDVEQIWGDPIAIKPYPLLKKSALFPPKRRSIKPGKGTQSEGEFKLDALELEDMPSRYTLSMDEGVHIFIRSRPKPIFSGIWKVLFSLSRLVCHPLATTINALQGKSYTAISLILEKRDAQALYWSFLEGSESIIITARK
jgi:hypothetical protein